jgi:hypothetical protein
MVFMSWRSGLLSGGVIAGVASCALLGVTSASALAATQDSPSAPLPTTTTVHLAAPTVRYANEQAEVVSFKVTSPQGTPTGALDLTVSMRSGVLHGMIGLVNGTASFSPFDYWAPAAPGTVVTVTAAYNGDGTFAASAAAAQAFTIVKDPTATSLSLSQQTLTYGNEQLGGATVSVTAPGATPGDSNGPAGIVETTLPAVSYTRITSYDPVTRFPFYRLSYPAGVTKVTATYFGDGNFLSSTSQAIMLRINKATTKTRLALKATRITYGHEQSERLSATVSPQYAGTPGGKVVIKHGTAVVCTITLAGGAGSCALTAKALPVAVNHLSATYTGDGNFTSSGAPLVLTVIR